MASKDTPKTPTLVYTLTGARQLTVGDKTYKRGQEIPAADVVGFEQYCTVTEK